MVAEYTDSTKTGHNHCSQEKTQFFEKKTIIYLQSIFETQPWDTLSCLEITQGLIPIAAISTILWRM